MQLSQRQDRSTQLSCTFQLRDVSVEDRPLFIEVEAPIEAAEMAAEACEIPAEWRALRHASPQFRFSRRALQQGSTTACVALTSFVNSVASMDVILRGAHPCAALGEAQPP